MWIRTLDGIILKQISNVNYEGIIKKQGDNLINVLEERDILISRKGKIMITEKFDFDSFNIKEKEVFKVITHEQYMPLAQEIK